MKHLFLKSMLCMSSAIAMAQSLDPSFGVGGKTILQAYSGTEYSLIDSKVAPNGDVYTLGNNYVRRLNTSDIVLRKFTKDGQLDYSFASGGEYIVNNYYLDYGKGLLLDQRGNVVFVGYTKGWGGVSAIYILKLNSQGAYVSGGTLTATTTIGELEPISIAQDDAGHYFVGAKNIYMNQNNFYVIKADTMGNLVSSFGNGGVAEVDFTGGNDLVTDLCVDGNTLVLAGSSKGTREQFAVAALNANDGSMKTSFGTGGKLVFNVSTTGDDRANNILKLPNGKLLLSGYAKLPARSIVALASFDAQTGALDSGFDGDGKRLVYLSGQSDQSTDAVVYKGSVYLAGLSYQYDGALKSVILKILADGSNDYSFGSLGTYVLDQQVGGYGAHNATLGFQEGNRPVLASVTNYGEPLVMRLITPTESNARSATTTASLQSEAMSAYPNPAVDKVTFSFAQELTAGLEGARLTLVDVYGTALTQDLILTGNSLELSVATLEAGVYSAQVLTSEGKLIGLSKFVVQP